MAVPVTEPTWCVLLGVDLVHHIVMGCVYEAMYLTQIDGRKPNTIIRPHPRIVRKEVFDAHETKEGGPDITCEVVVASNNNEIMRDSSCCRKPNFD